MDISDDILQKAHHRLRSDGRTRFHQALQHVYSARDLSLWLKDKAKSYIPWNIRAKDHTHVIVDVIRFLEKAEKEVKAPIGEKPEWWDRTCPRETYEESTRQRRIECVKISKQIWEEAKKSVDWSKITPTDVGDILRALPSYHSPEDQLFYETIVNELRENHVSFDKIKEKDENLICTPCTFSAKRNDAALEFWVMQPEPLEMPKFDNGILFYLLDRSHWQKTLEPSVRKNIIDRKPSMTHRLNWENEKDWLLKYRTAPLFKTPLEMALYHEAYDFVDYATNIQGDLDDQHIESLTMILSKIKSTKPEDEAQLKKRHQDLEKILNYPTFTPKKWKNASQKLLIAYTTSILCSPKLADKAYEWLNLLLKKGCSFDARMEETTSLISRIFFDYDRNISPQELLDRLVLKDNPNFLYHLAGVKVGSPKVVAQMVEDIFSYSNFYGSYRHILAFEKILNQFPTPNHSEWPEKIDDIIFSKTPKGAISEYEIKHILGLLKEQGWTPSSECWIGLRDRCLDLNSTTPETMKDAQPILLSLANYLIQQKTPVHKALFSLETLVNMNPINKIFGTPSTHSANQGYQGVHPWTTTIAFDTHFKICKLGLSKIADINHSDQKDPSILERLFAPLRSVMPAQNMTADEKLFHDHIHKLGGLLFSKGANPYLEPHKPLATATQPHASWAEAEKGNVLFNRFDREYTSEKEYKELRKTTMPVSQTTRPLRRI